MKQQHLADSFVQISAQIEAQRRHKPNCGNFTADEIDLKLYAVLASDADDKIGPCIKVLMNTCLIASLGERTRIIAEVLGMSSAPEFIAGVKQKENLTTDQLGGFTLGVLRACVEIPDFLCMPLTPTCVEELLLRACYPWGAQNNREIQSGRLDDRWEACPHEPSMDVSGSASALNEAARKFIRHESGFQPPSDGRGRRLYIAQKVLSQTQWETNKNVPLGWVGRKVMEPMLEEYLRQLTFGHRVEGFLYAMDQIKKQATSAAR